VVFVLTLILSEIFSVESFVEKIYGSKSSCTTKKIQTDSQRHKMTLLSEDPNKKEDFFFKRESFIFLKGNSFKEKLLLFSIFFNSFSYFSKTCNLTSLQTWNYKHSNTYLLLTYII